MFSPLIAILTLELLFISIPHANSAVTVTDNDLATISEALLAADTNNAASLVTVNLQGTTTQRGSDNAPQPLLTVQPAAYRKPTIAKLLPLQDNYIPEAGTAEKVTPAERTEESQFLDAILPTIVMQKAEQFLIDKGFINPRRTSTSRLNNQAFREALQEIWLGLYSRENRTLGSSGFEHIFLGETKNGLVSGFHNWVFFAKQEESSKLNYNGYMKSVSLGNKGSVVKHNFKWNGILKPVTSMFVGTSPEFEMAIYTICFYARPGTRCPITLNRQKINIQTHYFTVRGKRYIASGYPDI